MKKIILIVIIAFVMNIETAEAQKISSLYKIANKFSVEGDGGWDYLTVDDTTGHLFISHEKVVQVMDMKDGKIIGTVKGLDHVHGIAFAENMNHGYATNGRDSSLTIFNLKTFEVISKVANVGQNPDAVLFDVYTQRVFIFNGRSNNIAVIDPSNYKIIKKIPLDGNPEFAVNDDKGNIYVNIENLSMICKINASTMQVVEKFKLGEGKEPSGLAYDKGNKRLFSVCDNKMMIVMDAETGKIITTLPIGDGVDGCVYDKVSKRIFSSNGDGTLTVVQQESADKYKVLGNLETIKGARTISLSTKTHHLYLPTAEMGDKPEPTKENPHPRKQVKPGTFVILDIEPVK